MDHSQGQDTSDQPGHPASSKSDPPASRPNPKISRRCLSHAAIASSAVAGLSATGYPFLRYLSAAVDAPPSLPHGAIDIAAATEFPPGACRYFSFDGKPAVVFRRRDASIGACFAVCTHLGCTLEFRSDQDDLRCGCHGARFDASSLRVIAGPALRPLQSLPVEVRDGRIVVVV